MVTFKKTCLATVTKKQGWGPLIGPPAGLGHSIEMGWVGKIKLV